MTEQKRLMELPWVGQLEKGFNEVSTVDMTQESKLNE